MRHPVILPLVSLLGFAAVVDAQPQKAALQGSVEDSSGAVIAGAVITILDASGGAVRQAQTDTEGKFRIDQLPAGSYQLRAEFTGFDPQTRPVVIAAGEFRILIGREVGSTASLQPGVRLVVPDAFTAGGAQADQRSSEYHIQLAENVSYSRGRHLFKAGFALRDLSRRAFDDRTNQAGTFTFGSLEDYQAGRPLSFLQQRGDGRMAFLQRVFAGFAQDQIAVRHDLTVGLGVRYDWQNIFVDNNNFAPRASMAYTPDKQTVLRGGIGWFYDRGGDGAIREVLRSREEKLFRYLLLDPAYPDPFAGASSGATPPRSIVQLAPGIDMPHTVQYSAGIERQVRKGTTVAAT